MAEVYWIHLPEHTDMFSQGYIGFTSKTSTQRYSQHKSVSKHRKPNTPLSNAIVKYGDKLCLDTVCICSNEYGLWLENRLRSSCAIGWNLALGGEAPSVGRVPTDQARENMRRGQLGRKQSQETKDKIAKSNARRVITEATRLKMSVSRKSRVTSEDTRNKLSKAGTGRKQSDVSIQKSTLARAKWKTGNKDVWLLAKELYDAWLNREPRKLAKKFLSITPLATKSSIDRMVVAFNEGWNPYNDAEYATWFRTNTELMIYGA